MRLFSKNDSINRYDLLIILIIACLAYGGHEILRALHPIRIIGMVALPFVIVRMKMLLKSVFRPYVLFTLFWWCYMLLSIIWTPDKKNSIIYLYHMTTMFSSIFLMIFCGLKAKTPLRSLVNGWTLFCLITLPIAYWEITTGDHLSSGSFNAETNTTSHFRIFAAVTFANLNSFVLMLSIALPFVCIGLFDDIKQSKVMKLLRWLVLVGITLVLIINASRTGIICLVLSMGLLFVYQFKQNSIIKKVALVTLVLIALPYALDSIFAIEGAQQITSRLEGKSSIMEDDSRTMMIVEGLKVASEYLFLGGGTASMTYLYKSHNSTGSLFYAHNLIIELLIEYGLVICMLFVFYYYKFLYKLRGIKMHAIQYLFFYILLASPFMFAIDDSYQWRTSVWMQMASVFSILAAQNKLKTKR